MDNTDSGKMIPEILRFLGDSNGSSLVIAGDAGTGKTTFSLHMVELYSDFLECYYMSSRVNDVALLHQYKWLEEKAKNHIISKPVIYQNKVKGVTLDVERERKMTSINSRYLDDLISHIGHVDYSASRTQDLLQKVKNIYQVVEHNLPDPTLVVIDSVNGIADEYGIKNENIVFAVQKDLVEGANAKVIFVMEQEDSTVNYLADGLIVLKREFIDNKLLRVAEIKKLRGIEIENTHYLFSLNNGKFHVPIPCDAICRYEYTFRNGKLSAKSPAVLSTGITDLDRILIEGGIAPSKSYLFTIQQPLSISDSLFITQPIINNAYLNDYNIVLIKTYANLEYNKQSADFFRTERNEISVNHITRNIGAIKLPGIKNTYISEDGRTDAFHRNFLLSPFKSLHKKTLFMIDLDDIANSFKVDVNSLLSLTNDAKNSEDSIIIISSFNNSYLDTVTHNVDQHILLRTAFNHIVLYGVYPFSPVYAVNYSKDSEGSLSPVYLTKIS